MHRECDPGGKKIYEWLREQLLNYNIHMIFMLSHNYYDSAASLNEMGAAWFAKTESTLVLLPGFGFSDIKGCIDSSEMGIALDGDINELKHRLGELKDNLCEEFKLSPMSATKWERYRDGFLGKIQSDVSKERIQEEKSDDSQLYIPIVENYNNETVSVETAFLLVYAAAGDGRILRLATLGAPVQVSAAGKQFMADNSQRESAIWQELYIVDTNEENSFPETESKLFILDGLEHRIRPSKFDSPYDLYDDDEGKKIN